MLIYCSATYDRINKTWFGAWAWNRSTYGPTEIRTIYREGYIEVAEYKVGTSIKHGRRVKIYISGTIIDAFCKDDQLHGPSLEITPFGSYFITQWEDDRRVSE